MTVLSSVKKADFTFLQRTTGLTKGNLSSHLTKLEAAGLVTITKTFIRKKPNTSVALTPVGQERVARHLASSSACAISPPRPGPRPQRRRPRRSGRSRRASRPEPVSAAGRCARR